MKLIQMRYLISCLCSTVIKSFQNNSNNEKARKFKKVEGQKKKGGEQFLIVILFWQITIQSSKAMNINKMLLKQ